MNRIASQIGAPESTLKEEALLSRKVKLAARESGLEHTDVALAVIELGDFYYQEERYVDSSEAYKKAVDIYDALGEGHQLLQAIAMRSLSNSLSSQGKYSEAASLKKNAHELIRSYQ
jgi:tetratricopeptide (TPR) repeat protein